MTFIVGEVENYKNYANKNLISSENQRFTAPFKIIAILPVFFISEYFSRKYNKIDAYELSIRLLRMALFFVLIVLSFYPRLDELFARILLYYFVVESVLIMLLWVTYNRSMAIVIVFSYTLAINSIHVLSGKF